MTKKKRVTLPKNFDELIQSGDIERLKAVYNHCELYAAYNGRYGLNTALHHYDVPDSLVYWLVKQGLDVNIENYYGRTPLSEQAAIGSDTVKLLFELGADIEKTDRYGHRPLHHAANHFRKDTVCFLVENGANIHAKNDKKQTPLASSLAICRNADIPKMAEIASVLLKAGAEVTSDMIKNVERIGKDFEFNREDFNKDYLAKTDAGIKKLYALFDVKPIAKRQIHDGVSPIHVEDGPWKKQYEKLWDLLVPSMGAAKTVQGEVIRITGRIQDELYRNGGINWDKNYRKMLNALLRYFASGTALSQSELAETKRWISHIHAKGTYENKITDRLCELSVLWVSSNPAPVPLSQPDYDR